MTDELPEGVAGPTPVGLVDGGTLRYLDSERVAHTEPLGDGLARDRVLSRMIPVAERMADRIVKLEVLGRRAEEMEINRGAVKWAVIERLIQTVAAPGGKPLSFSQANSTEALGQDAAYRDYIKHLGELTGTLERLKYEQALDALNYRALIATLELCHVK